MKTCKLKLKLALMLYLAITITLNCYLIIMHNLGICTICLLLFVIFTFVIKCFMQIKDLDVFTGVYKKTRLIEDLKKREEKSKKFSLCLIDFNGLKKINDEYGHIVGDKLILAFSDTLKQLFKADKEIILYRYTCGDEFCIVSYTDNLKKIIDFKNKIETISSIDVPIDLLDGKPFLVPLTVSYGFSEFDGSKSILKVIDEADKNMYEYKKQFKEKQAN